MFARKSSQSDASEHRTMGNGIRFVTAMGNLTSFDAKQRKSFRDLRTIERNLSSSVGVSMHRQRICVDKINKVIAGSTCSICSGRSNSFFEKNCKLKISESLCRSVLFGCTNAWNDMIYIADQVRRYTGIVRALNRFVDSDTNMEERAFTMNLDGFVNSRKIREIIEQCGSNDLKKCSFKHVSSLCEQFIHIQSPTYVESALSHSKKLSSAVFGLQASLIKMRPFFHEKVAMLRKMMKAKLNNDWFEKVLGHNVDMWMRVKAMKDHWYGLKLREPLMESILKGTEAKHPDLRYAFKTCKNESRIIISDVAQASIVLHAIQRKAIEDLRTRKDQTSKSLLHKFKMMWGILSVIVENIRFSRNRITPDVKFYQHMQTWVLSYRNKSLAVA